MSVLETIVSLFAPHICVGCGSEEDRLLCAGCASSLVVVPSRCYHCAVATDNYEVCATCAARTALHQVAAFAHYQGPAKALVRRLKFERAQAGAGEMADLLADLLTHFPANVVLTHVPTATSRVRARGYDHARLVARSLARQAGVHHVTLLARVGQTRQVGASRTERLRQLQSAFRPVHLASIRGRHVVLVDDVLTTGATLETAAGVLKQAGAKSVGAIVFAQA